MAFAIDVDTTIVLPVYNTAKYLEQCLSSIVKQTDSCWNCLIIDDGSTDGSAELIDQLVGGDERFIVVHRENHGAPASRNMALDFLSETKPDYVYFVDSDDVLHHNLISNCRRVLEKNNLVDAVRINALSFSDDGGGAYGLHQPLINARLKCLTLRMILLLQRVFAPHGGSSSVIVQYQPRDIQPRIQLAKI